MDGRTTDNGPWHKLAGLRPVELTRGPWWPWIAHLSQFPHKMSSTFSITIVPTYDPPGWGQFWQPGYHMNRIDIGPNIIVQGQMIKALLLLVSEKKNFKVFLLCSYVSNLWPPGRGPIWPQGHDMNNLGKGPLGDATYKISKLCTF